MKKKNLLIGLIVLVIVFGIYQLIPKHNVFVRTGDMNYARSGHKSVLLNDGNVLLVGGNTCEYSNNCQTATYVSETYYPKKMFNKFSIMTLKEMGIGNVTVLKNGKVLICGSLLYKTFTTNNKDTSICALFNSTVDTYNIVGSLNYPRHYNTTTLLQDGRVLIVGGGSGNISELISYSEIYNPKTNKIEIGPKMLYPRVDHQAILLKDGCVLIIGGKPHIAELYDPKINKFVKIKNMNYPAYFLQTATLNDGRVLTVTGSKKGEVMEVFDPARREFNILLDKIPDKSPSSTMTVLKNGNVLFTGGYKKENWYGISTKGSLIFNPITKQFIKGPDMKIKRGEHTATLLQDGKVLITGGYSKGPQNKLEKSAELYIP